jgi:hypothetical protein
MYRKNVYDAGNYAHAVIKASTNIKLGKKVTKGHLKGAKFFNLEYILFWRRQLAKREYLNVYGYTRNHPTKPLGYALKLVRQEYGKRFAVRFSNYPDDPFSAQSEHVSTGGVGCPVQMNRTDSCGTCTLCWEMEDKSIIFYDH